MPNSGFSWGAKLSEIADAVWTRSIRDLTNLPDVRAAKIDNLDVALSSRATAADVWGYATRKLTAGSHNVFVIPSENLKVQADIERSTTSTAYKKVKEIVMPYSGKVRVRFDLRIDISSQTAYARVYRNGAEYGTNGNTTSTTYVTFTEDLCFEAMDFVQLYIATTAGGTVYTANFRLYYDIDDGIPQIPIITLN